MRAGYRACLFLALMLGLFSALPTGTASPAKPIFHRRFLQDYTSLGSNNSHARHLLQSCSSCPATATASGTCSAASDSLLNTIRADLISKCSTTGFNPSRCCEIYTLSNWNTYAACACSDTIPGLSAFVDGDTIMSACGCGPSASSTGTTTGTTTPDFIGRASSSNGSGSTSSSIDIAAVYSAVSFPSSGGRDSSSSGDSTSASTVGPGSISRSDARSDATTSP